MVDAPVALHVGAPRTYVRIYVRGLLTSILLALQTIVVSGDHGVAASVVAFAITHMAFGNWQIAADCRALRGAKGLYAFGAACGVYLGTGFGHQLAPVVRGLLARLAAFLWSL